MADDRVPARLRVFLTGCLLSAVGSGAVAPFTAIYLTSARALALGTVGLVLAVIAATNILGSMVGGALIDRCGMRGTVTVSLPVQAAGYLVLAVAATPWTALVAAVLVGVG